MVAAEAYRQAGHATLELLELGDRHGHHLEPPGRVQLGGARGVGRHDHGATTVGRHPESDIFLDDVTVSRRHAEFVREGGGFLVRDVGSLNGTYLDRERIDSAGLAGGDEVQIGKYRLVFLAGARSEHS